VNLGGALEFTYSIGRPRIFSSAAFKPRGPGSNKYFHTMSVAQRGKQAQWPSAGGAGPTGSGLRISGVAGEAAAAAEREAALRWLENRDGGRSVLWYRRLARAIWNRCNHINAPVVYPWSPSRRGTGIAHAFHRFAAGTSRRHYGRGLARVLLWVKAWCWPVMAMAVIPALLWRCGRRVRDSRGLSLAAQARDLWAAAWRHGIFPTEYYHHRIFRTSPDVDRAEYLNEREVRALLRECARGCDADRLDQLARFMTECREAGLPALRTPAVFENGRARLNGDADALPPRDLFLRPARWTAGIPGEQWRWNAQARAWMYRGETRDAAALLEHGAHLASRRTWVAHESISNHPDITRFSAGGVCTAHLATGLDEAGQPQVLFAALHLPASADGGWGPGPGELVAGIEVATGRLGVAMDEFVSDGEFSSHPGSGVMIEDAIVPQWSTLVALALQAHRRFGEFPFVGWRVALAGSGPILVEASTDWGVFRHVWPAQTKFGPWCRARLAPLLGTASP